MLGIYFDLFKLDEKYKNETQEDLQKLLKEESNIRKILTEFKGTGETNESGQIRYTGLETGVYLLRETDNEDKKGSHTYSSNGDTIGYSMNIGKIMKIELKDNNLDVSVRFYNTGYGGLKIQKLSNNGEALNNVTFKLYLGSDLKDTGYEFKTDANGNASSKTTQTSYGVEYSTPYCIPSGTYYLFETENPNMGYNIKFQGTTIPDTEYEGKSYIPGKGAFIKKVKIETGQICDLTENNAIENEPYVSIYINKFIENLSGSETTRIKADETEKNKAGFQLYKGDKVVSLTNINNSKKYAQFFTDSNGKVSIERIPVNATYTLYETTFPEDVDPTIQPGYDYSKEAVKIATIKVDKYGNIEITDEVTDKQKIKDAEDGKEYFYRASSQTVKTAGKEATVTFRVTNRKYIKISGYVWEDISANTKTPENGNNLYSSTGKDERIPIVTKADVRNGKSGVQVNLYKRRKNNYDFYSRSRE